MPWSLIVLVGGIAASTYLDLSGKGVRVVGDVPTGIPIPSIPIVDVSLWGGIVTGGLAIAAVGIAEGLAAVRTFAPSGAVDPDTDNQEFLAHGAADLASGLFGGMGVGGSLSKTAANARAGAYTQVSGVAAAVVVIAFVLFAAGLLANLPRTVLAAIVIHAVWGLVSVSAFRRYIAVRRNDFLAAVVAFLGVLVLGPLNGLLLAVGQSLLGLVYRSMQVQVDEMGRVEGEKAAWGSVANDPTRRTYSGVAVLRPDGPLFWANANLIVQHIETMARGREHLRAVVLDLEATNQMDTTSAERLQQMMERLRSTGIDLYLVRVFGNVRDVLTRSGFLDELGPGHVWHSIAAGVKAARSAPPIAVVLPGGAVLPGAGRGPRRRHRPRRAGERRARGADRVQARRPARVMSPWATGGTPGAKGSVQEDGAGGIKALIAEQFVLPGQLTVTLSQFDDAFDTVARMSERPFDFELEPRGMTALFDAAGMEVVRTGEVTGPRPRTTAPPLAPPPSPPDGRAGSGRHGRGSAHCSDRGGMSARS